MATQPAVRQSDHEDETPHGLLFRISARAGLVLFVAVVWMGTDRGLDPGTAVMRGTLALLAVTACGWLAEQVVKLARPETEAAAAVEAETRPPGPGGELKEAA